LIVFNISWAISWGFFLVLWEIGKARVRAKSAEIFDGNSHCKKESFQATL